MIAFYIDASMQGPYAQEHCNFTSKQKSLVQTQTNVTSAASTDVQ